MEFEVVGLTLVCHSKIGICFRYWKPPIFV
jgi:hypothetical protein